MYDSRHRDQPEQLSYLITIEFNAPINVLPHLATSPPLPPRQKVRGFDLILLKNMPQIRGI